MLLYLYIKTYLLLFISYIIHHTKNDYSCIIFDLSNSYIITIVNYCIYIYIYIYIEFYYYIDIIINKYTYFIKRLSYQCLHFLNNLHNNFNLKF